MVVQRKERRNINYKPRYTKPKYAIKPTLQAHKKAIAFRNYILLHYGSQRYSYGRSRIKNINENLAVKMEIYLFNLADLIFMLDCLQKFWCACNNLSIHEGISIFLLSHFMIRSAKTDRSVTVSKQKKISTTITTVITTAVTACFARTTMYSTTY